MRAHVGEPQRSGVLDQHAKHPTAARRIADLSACLLIDSPRDEALQPGPLHIEHTERRIAGARDLPGGLQDEVEHLVRIQLRHERAADLQEAAHPSLVELVPHLRRWRG